MVDTGTRDKFNTDNDLYITPSDSFWEVSNVKRSFRMGLDLSLAREI